jgi:hypothetical protein
MAEPSEALKPMKQVQELLQDEGLRRQIVEARDDSEVTKLLVSAGEPRGYQFAEDWLHELFEDVRLNRTTTPFRDDELLELASTFNVANTPPMLCHSDSCGGGHKGCC